VAVTLIPSAAQWNKSVANEMQKVAIQVADHAPEVVSSVKREFVCFGAKLTLARTSRCARVAI
jgi:hypothetical protein